MSKRDVHIAIGCFVLFGILAVASGCSKQKEAEKVKKEADAKEPIAVDQEAAKEAGAEATAHVEAKLAAADALDGTTDKIVSKCATCELGMAGKSEHTLSVSGYTLYFCTDKCRRQFAADTTKSIREMTIPEE